MISRFRTWLAFKIAPWLTDEWWDELDDEKRVYTRARLEEDDDGPFCTGVPYLESVGCQDPDCPLHRPKSTGKYETGGTIELP